MNPRRLGLLLLSLLLFVVPRMPSQQTGGMWALRSPMPVPLSEVGTAAVGGRIYVVGGLTITGAPSTTLQIYDPFLDSWSLGPPLPLEGGVDHPNVAAGGGKLYVLGGLAIVQGRATARTFEFDPATGSWTEKAPLPTARSAGGTAELGGKIYVAGGQRGGLTVNDFAVFDPATNTWMELPSMPTPRNHLTAQALDGKFYAIGGRPPLTGVVEMYDPQSNTWTPLAPMPTPRSGIASGTLRSRIQVLGGETSTQPGGTFQENEEYDPATNTWQPLAPLPTPRHGFYGVALNGRLYAPGGGTRAGLSTSAVNEVFFFPPDRPPEATEAGVADAASFQPRLAAGGLVSLFGKALADASAQASRFPLPDSLFEASVLVNGQPVPLLFVSESQVNFQLPFDATGTVALQLRNAGSDCATFDVTVEQAAPGIFAGAVLHNSTFQPVTDSSPATPEEVLAVFAAGLGPVQPPVEAGQAAPALLLATTTLPVTAMLGGTPAPVLFSGLAPGFAGVYQVNLSVPSLVPTGDEIPLTLSVGGVTSNQVNVAIR